MINYNDLDTSQKTAIKLIVDWFFSDRHEFRMGGYAGTGKTEIIRFAVEQIKERMASRNEAFLNEQAKKRSEVLSQLAANSPLAQLMVNTSEFTVYYATPTGKAAMELQKRGLPASTIHSLLYIPEKRKDPVTKESKLVFSLNPAIVNSLDIDLIIIDEASMVNYEIYTDLCRIKTKLLLVGDHGQLESIPEKDSKFPNFSLMKETDVKLEKLHRYAGAIAEVCDLARKGLPINFGSYGNQVIKLNWDDLEDRHIIGVDQIICGKNDSRRDINNICREILGYDSTLPMAGDKMIIKKNNMEKGIVNGMLATTLKDVTPMDINYSDGTMRMDILTELGAAVEGIKYDITSVNPDRYRDVSNKFKLMELDKIDYGYAITAHASQGSGFNKTLVYSEAFGNFESRKRWEYTAYSRAKNKLIIAIP